MVDGGSDVNAVNKDNGMPLNIIKARLKNEPDDDGLNDIYEYLFLIGMSCNVDGVHIQDEDIQHMHIFQTW